MKKFTLITLSYLGGITIFSQGFLTPVITNNQTNTTNSTPENGLDYPEHLNDLIIHPIHDYHWYAIENKDDSVYWSNIYQDRFIIQLETGYDLSNAQLLNILAKYSVDSVISQSKFPHIQNFYKLYLPNGNKTMLLNLIDEVRNLPFIQFLEPSPVVKSEVCYPNDANWSSQWAPHTILADSVYCYFIGSTRQWVGIIDDAVDYTHPDLVNIVQYGYDFVYNDPNPYPDLISTAHGTHVSGITGAKINNGIGISGISNDTIYFAKVSDNAGNLDDVAITNAINDMALTTKLRTYNMSFRSLVPVAAWQTAITNTVSNGKLPIAAAGNDATSAPAYPAAYTNVVSVSSLGVDNLSNYTLASYSNYGSTIDICAPGGETSTGWGIYSTIPSSSYAFYQGTSMAAPAVTGVAALMFAVNPFLTVTQARNILLAQTFEFGTPGYDIYYGNGIVCAFCAYEEACTQMSAPISVSGTTSFCNGSSRTLTAPFNFNVNYQWKRNGTNIAGATSNTYVATLAGTYVCVIQSLAGCTYNSNSIVLTITPLPLADFNYVVSGNDVTFTSTSLNATSFSWNFGDGGTSTLANPTHTYGSPGLYNVTLTVNNACGADNIVKVVQIQNTAGIEENEMLNVNIYPNPSTDFVNISYETSNTHNLEILLFDGVGKVIYSIKRPSISGNVSNVIPVEELANGIYFLKIVVGNQTYSSKFIKQ